MRRQSGFSLVELMVAMTVTLIVSAAIYGLLTSGSNAFRREPELADRQQNIRVALDSISRDVFNAGAALPTFSQVFTIADPSGGCTGGLDGCGIPGAIEAAEDSDVLELVTTIEDCLEQSVCSPVAGIGAAGLYVTRQSTPGCLRLPGLALLARNDYFSVHTAAVGGGAGTTYCPPSGGRHPQQRQPRAGRQPRGLELGRDRHGRQCLSVRGSCRAVPARSGQRPGGHHPRPLEERHRPVRDGRQRAAGAA